MRIHQTSLVELPWLVLGDTLVIESIATKWELMYLGYY